MRVCSKKGCETRLSIYNPDDRCSIHVRFAHHRYDWAGAKDRWFEERKASGIPPMGNRECPNCLRIHKSVTSCVCAARPAPRADWGRAA